MIGDMRQGVALVRGAVVLSALVALPLGGPVAAHAVTVPGASVDAGPVHVSTPPVTVNPPATHTPVDPVVGGVNNTANHVTSQVPSHVSVPGTNGSPVSISPSKQDSGSVPVGPSSQSGGGSSTATNHGKP